jgi:hypothetical protein
MAQGIHTVAEMSAFYQSPASASLRAAVHAAGERLGKGTRAERAQAKADYKAALNAIRDAVSAFKA